MWRYRVVIGMVAAAAVAAVIGGTLTATAPVPGIVDSSWGVHAGLIATRVVLDLSALGSIGLSLLPLLVGHSRVRETVSVALVCTNLVWAVSAFALLVLQTADFRPERAVTPALLADYVRTVTAGKTLAVVAALAVVSVVVSVLAVRRPAKVAPELRLGLAVFTLLPLPATGHAADSTTWLHDAVLVSLELHVVGAMAWAGGLLAVVIVLGRDRELLLVALPRFSALAGICLGVVAVTGVVNAVAELSLNAGTPWYQALLTTGYGQIVLLKTACLVVIGGFGARMRLRLLPMVQRRLRTGLVGFAALELAVMGLAYGFAAVLSRAPVLPG
jgi:putative copper resistance protein D